MLYLFSCLLIPDSTDTLIVGKEPACNAGDPGSIPGSGRSAREGIGYPLQYSWASLVAQLVNNPLAIQKTWVRSLGWEDPLEKGKAIHSQYSCLENSMGCIVHGVAKSWTQLRHFHFHLVDALTFHVFSIKVFVFAFCGCVSILY